MDLMIWILIFLAGLAALIKGADYLLESAEKIGLRLGLSSFVVGVVFVGFGTSLPELVSSFVAIFQGVPEVVVANAVGSNIANILLVVGISAFVARRLTVSKNLIDSELPMLAISTVIFLGVIYDGSVSFGESFFLLASYFVYLFYTIYGGEGDESRHSFSFSFPDKVVVFDIIKLIVGLVALILGAKYLIDALIHINIITGIQTSVISITAVAIGTSLPELIVSIKAALHGKTEIAIGNIFGSNAVNALVVVGLPGLFMTTKSLPIDNSTLLLGMPVMALATLIFVISSISRTIYRWEGMMFLLFYMLFICKLFAIL